MTDDLPPLTATLTPWHQRTPPTEGALDELLRSEGLTPRWWSNGPGDRYAAHDHPYHKVLYCASGSIRFVVGGANVDLSPGDRLDIPPGTPHSAVVGPEGVTCAEAARG
ncbi:MAG: cupin domain-containing protein [Dehalococcoidia bacterium]